MEPDNPLDDPLCFSAKTDVPFKKNKATEELSGHIEGNTGDLRNKKSLDETAHKQLGDSSHVNLKQIDKQASMASCSQEGAGDARFIGRPPSPIALPDRSRTLPFDDDDYIPEGLKYSSADKGMVVADISNQSDTAWDGVILDSSNAAAGIATPRKANGSFESADEA